MYLLELDDRASPDAIAPLPSSGATAPVLLADDWRAVLAYHVAEVQESARWKDLTSDSVAVCTFAGALGAYLGAPNDEALPNHPLYGRGLGFYGVHRVVPSTWADQLTRRAIKQGANRPTAEVMHYLITMHDSTFETVCTSVETEIATGPPAEAAIDAWTGSKQN